jgi:hypothetical protein
MKTRIKVSVTDKHIKEGKCDNPRYCPIALAIKELGFEKVYVDKRYFLINKEHYGMPKKACAFIGKFDENNDVRPFSFVAVKTTQHKEI